MTENLFSCVFSILNLGKFRIFCFPPFKLAISPGSIKPESNRNKNHDDKPLKEKAEPRARKLQLPALNIGIAANPSLLCGVSPREKEATRKH